MKIIISPSKKMKDSSDDFLGKTTPIFQKEAGILLEYLKHLPLDALKKVLSTSETLTLQSKALYEKADLESAISPALFSYDGIQFQYMAPSLMSEVEHHYLNNHLFILSGLYGLLKPFDKVIEYRLEMQAKLKDFNISSLYAFWGDRIFKTLTNEDTVILNLASGEYAKVIETYAKKNPKIRFVTCRFEEEEDGVRKEKGVYVKMARGAMVRYLAEHQIDTLEGVKTFSELSYQFREDLSTENAFIFTRK